MHKYSLSLFLFLAGCAPLFEDTVSVDKGSCPKACEVLAALKCPEASPTENGASCVEVCEANRDMLAITCVSKASSIADVKYCSVRCKLK